MSGLVVAVIVSIVTSIIPQGWHTVGTWISAAWKWLGGSASLPMWTLALLGLLALVVLVGVAIFACVLLLGAKKIAKPSEIDFKGLKWRWRWRQGDLDNIATFCPVCDMQIHPTYYPRGLPPQTIYFCDRCNQEKLKVEGKPTDLTDVFTREIQRQQRRQRQGVLGSEAKSLPEPAPVPGELNETLFEGIRWRWRFLGNEMVEIDTYCPHCDFHVQPYQENPYCPTIYDCPSCRAHLKVHLGTQADLRDRFVRLVQRETRNLRRL